MITNALEDALNSVTVGSLKAFFNPLSAVTKEGQIISNNSLKIFVGHCCQQNIPILQIKSGCQYVVELLCQSGTCHIC